QGELIDLFIAKLHKDVPRLTKAKEGSLLELESKKPAMSIETVLHMNTGNGESSYATNSYLQEYGIQRALHVTNEAINRMCNDLGGFPGVFKIADLGCSSGPNALLGISNIISRVHDISLPTFYAKLKNAEGDHCSPCFVSAVPGSFYSRLFPNKSIHLFLSSYAVHWLSQVPQGLENNKHNIYMAKTSPTNGRIPESDIDSFNIPYYTPYEDEVRDVIKKEGSFLLDNLYSFALDWEPYNGGNAKMDVADRPIRGKNTAKLIRAVMEPMMATHFGNSIMDMSYSNSVNRHLNVLEKEGL
nr:benzoate carboxyl methyltransferase-like [Tanacetum cinerariifolium]